MSNSNDSGFANLFILAVIGYVVWIAVTSQKKSEGRNEASPNTQIDVQTSPQQYDNPVPVRSMPMEQQVAPQKRVRSSKTPDDAYDEGYEEGYEQGKEDGQRGRNHGYGYDDSSDYYGYYETKYEEGYEDGYEEGYSEGESQYEEE